MMQLKNIIFDFGGVLIDWDPRHLYEKVFEDKDEMNFFLENICTYSWNIQQDAGRPLSVATAEKQAEFPHYREEIAMYYGRWEEMLGGVIDVNAQLIKPLKGMYNVYGLTNWSAETIPIAMKRYGFFDELDGMVVSGEEGVVKPDEKLYRILIERYSTEPAASLFIDDNAVNIQAAKELGFRTIHLTETVNLEEELKRMGVL